MKRRQLLQYLSLATATPAAFSARAQDFPSKPIRMIASSVPGTLVDQAARMYADKMQAYLKQPVVVENISGGSSLLAIRQLLRSPADGYTLLVSANTLVAQPHVNKKSGYTASEFTPVGEMCRSPMLLVTAASSPWKSLADLLAAAKKSPGQLSFGTSGTGTTNHLGVELLARRAGVSFTHVPYKGIAAAVPDVGAGRVSFLMGTPTSLQELTKSGALRALAISSDKRSTIFPDIPTLKELGYPEATFEIWIGTVAPAKLPPAVRARLAEAMEYTRNQPDVVKRLEAAGQEISAARTPEQFEAVMRTDDEKLGRVIREANIVTD